MVDNGETKGLITPPPRWVSAQLLNVWVSAWQRSRGCSQNLHRLSLRALMFLYSYYIAFRGTIFPYQECNECTISLCLCMKHLLKLWRSYKIIGYSTKLRCSKLSCRFILGSQLTSISQCSSASQPCQPWWGWVGRFVLLQHVGTQLPVPPDLVHPLWRNGTCSSSMCIFRSTLATWKWLW